MKRFLIILLSAGALTAQGQQTQWQGKFEQLGQTLPTPNEYRTGSGAPGVEVLAAEEPTIPSTSS